MANSATLNPTSKTGALDETMVTIRDRVLGAIHALGRGNRFTSVSEIRARLGDVSESELERAIAFLDREGAIVIDRGGEATLVKLAQPGLAAENVPCHVKDRVLGAIWTAARGPSRLAPLAEVRARVSDLAPAELERAIVALALHGEIELGRGFEQGWVRLSPLAKNETFFGTTHPMMMMTPLAFRPLVERVAHQLWETRGRQHGLELQNWIDAEQIVRSQVCAF